MRFPNPSRVESGRDRRLEGEKGEENSVPRNARSAACQVLMPVDTAMVTVVVDADTSEKEVPRDIASYHWNCEWTAG